MTKQERKKLQVDRDLLYRYALQFQTLERQIENRRELVLELGAELQRVTNEVASLERELQTLQYRFGTCLAQFVFDYDAGVQVKQNLLL